MAKVIAFNSINTKSGKSMASAYLGVALAAHFKTAVVDFKPMGSHLKHFCMRRQKICEFKKLELSRFDYFVYTKGLMNKLISEYDFVIVDQGEIEMLKYADFLVTMMSGQEGLKALLSKDSLYAMLIFDVKKQRAADAKSAFKWVVVPNDEYEPSALEELSRNGKFLGFEVTPKLKRHERLATGFEKGMTVLDKDVEGVKKDFDVTDFALRRNLKKIFEILWQNK